MGYMGKSKKLLKKIGAVGRAAEFHPAETSRKLMVSGIHTEDQYAPLALGICMAYAKACFENGADFEFSKQFVANEKDLSNLLQDDGAEESQRHVLLFSNYIWNREDNLHLSRLAKKLDPTCITVHGGPDTPSKYTEACEKFLFEETHIDYVVAGEGEETLKELLESISLRPDEIVSVSGVRFLSNGKYVDCGDRVRASNLDKFPSPYLTGTFDSLNASSFYCGIIESARGCPYSCTFCDWGSNTAAKIKTFDFDRVINEIEWFAEKKVKMIWLADANFGILKRDLEIVKKICEIKKKTGYPHRIVLCYSKTVKTRLIKIIDLMIEAGINSQGSISLQTRDPETLSAISRSNIKTSEYNKLHQAFVKRKFPYYVELLMALPGSTIEALKADLAIYFDQPVDVYINRSILLTNSPMADPDYQRKHQIKVDEVNAVIATATMCEADVTEARAICIVFQGVHRFGVLRYLVRWLEWEQNLKPLDIIQDLVRSPDLEGRYPLLNLMVKESRSNELRGLALVECLLKFRDKLRQESTWERLSDEFISWSEEKYNFKSDDAFASLGRVQAGLMPAVDRQFPEEIGMTHNVLKWYADWHGGKGQKLISYETGTLQITDPYDLCQRSCLIEEFIPKSRFELESQLSDIRYESLYEPDHISSPPDEMDKQSVILTPDPKTQMGARGL